MIVRRSLAFVCAVCFATAAFGVDYTYDAAGRLVKVEYDDASSIAYSYDKNGNLLQVQPSTSPDAIAEFLNRDFNALDTDGSGSLTFQEAQVGLPRLSQSDFNAIDRNSDGVLSASELVERCTPGVPQNVAASDGTSSDTIVVTWDSVGNADSYEIFRNTTNNQSGAQLLATVSLTEYSDTSAAAPKGTNHSAGWMVRGFRNPAMPAGVASVCFIVGVVLLASARRVARGCVGIIGSRLRSPTCTKAALLLTVALFLVVFMGCPRRTTSTHFYWVRAQNSCGVSDFSQSDGGHVGTAKSSRDRAVASVLETTMPSNSRVAGYRDAYPDSTWSIRLRGTGTIDTESMWARVSARTFRTNEFAWVIPGQTGIVPRRCSRPRGSRSVSV